MRLPTLLPLVLVAVQLVACSDGSYLAEPPSPDATIIDSPGSQVVVILCVTGWRDFLTLPDDGTIGASIDLDFRDFLREDFTVDPSPTIEAAPWADIDSFEEARAAAASGAAGCKLVWRRPDVSFDDESPFIIDPLDTPSRAWRYAIAVYDETDDFQEFNQDPPFPGGLNFGVVPPNHGIRVYVMYVTSVIRGPGYWKNAQNVDWAEAKVFPDDRLEFRFGPLPPGYDDWTFFQAFQQKGGGKGIGQLLRHAAAAYLNASHPHINYPWATEQVVEAVQAAIKAGDAAVEDQKNEFEKMNSVDEDEEGQQGG